MANQVTGKIVQIGRLETVQSKDGSKSFKKREIVLDATRFDPYTGERDKYENFPSFEFFGDKCDELLKYRTGQVVTISFDLRGNRFTDSATNEVKYFTRVNAYRIEARQAAQPQAQQAAPQAAQQPQTQPAQPQYSQGQMPFPPYDDNLPY